MAALLLAYLGVFCGYIQAKALKEVTLQLKWQHQFQFAGYYAAEQQGYYAEEGLEVTLRPAQPGTDPFEEVLEGHAEFGVGTSEIMLQHAHGQPLVVLAVIFQHSPLALLARRDKGIEHVHDLAGKRVMIEPNSAAFWAMLKYEQVSPKSLSMASHTQSIESLISAEVEAMTVYSTDEPYLLQQLDIPFTLISPRSAGIDFYGDNLFTTRELIRREPELAAAFRRASLRGWEYAMQHPEAIIELILKQYNPLRNREHLKYEAEHMRQLMQPQLISPGYMNPGRWKHIAETFAALGMMEAQHDFRSLLYQNETGYTHFYLLLGGTLILLAIVSLVALRIHHLKNAARASEERFREIYEAAPMAFVLFDPDMRIEEWNREAQNTFGWTHEEAVGKNILDLLVPEELKPDIEHMFREMLTFEQPTTRINRNRTREGKELWCSWSNVVQRDAEGEVKGILSLGLNITERIDNDRQLQIAREHLEAINADLRSQTAELEEARRAAEAADRAKSEFLAVISHEIRTPMNAIMGYANILSESSLPEEEAEMAATINSCAETLMSIINDILDLSKIEAGRIELHPEPIDPEAIAMEVHHMLNPLAQRKKLDFRYEVSLASTREIWGDGTRLRQILINLTGNAIKFTEHGHVTIRVKTSPDQDNPERLCLRLSVSDSGIGIHPNKLKELFKPFSQLHTGLSRKFGGTGLGLAISNKLCSLMGGTITVESEEGKGSTFVVEMTLPYVNESMRKHYFEG